MGGGGVRKWNKLWKWNKINCKKKLSTAYIEVSVVRDLVMSAGGDLTVSVRPDRSRCRISHHQARQHDRRFHSSPQHLRERRYSGGSYEMSFMLLQLSEVNKLKNYTKKDI